MINNLPQKFLLRRRIDDLENHFRRCDRIDGQAAWKRDGKAVWLTYQAAFGWVVVNPVGDVEGVPWGVSLAEQRPDRLPLGKWVSCKADKAYVYDLVVL